jgi:hypothetical protein
VQWLVRASVLMCALSNTRGLEVNVCTTTFLKIVVRRNTMKTFLFNSTFVVLSSCWGWFDQNLWFLFAILVLIKIEMATNNNEYVQLKND